MPVWPASRASLLGNPKRLRFECCGGGGIGKGREGKGGGVSRDVRQNKDSSSGSGSSSSSSRGGEGRAGTRETNKQPTNQPTKPPPSPSPSQRWGGGGPDTEVDGIIGRSLEPDPRPEPPRESHSPADPPLGPRDLLPGRDGGKVDEVDGVPGGVRGPRGHPAVASVGVAHTFRAAALCLLCSVIGDRCSVLGARCSALLCCALLCCAGGKGKGKERKGVRGRGGEARRVGRGGVGFLLGLGPVRLDLTVTVVLHCIPPTNPLCRSFFRSASKHIFQEGHLFVWLGFRRLASTIPPEFGSEACTLS